MSRTFMLLIDADPNQVLSQARGLPYAVIWAPEFDWVCKLLDSDTTPEELEKLREHASRLEISARRGRTRAKNAGYSIPWTIDGTKLKRKITPRSSIGNIRDSYRGAKIIEIEKALAQED